MQLQHLMMNLLDAMQQVQRHLQLRIEAQGKYLQSVLEKAQEALAKQSVDLDAGVLGEAAAAETQQLSELISRASATKRVQLHHQHLGGVGDGSVDSCLTACEGSQRDHDMLSIGLSPAPTPTPTPRGGYPFVEAARSGGNDRGGASTSCEEFLFLQEPAGTRGSSSDEQQELDLNINDRNPPRPRHCQKIDPNGSSWN